MKKNKVAEENYKVNKVKVSKFLIHFLVSERKASGCIEYEEHTH